MIPETDQNPTVGVYSNFRNVQITLCVKFLAVHRHLAIAHYQIPKYLCAQTKTINSLSITQAHQSIRSPILAQQYHYNSIFLLTLLRSQFFTMASSSVSTLPVQYEIIYVLFNMADTSHMWWKTTIDQITMQDNETVRAIAQITFDSGSDTVGNFYAAESRVMHFLSERSAVLLSTHSSFSTGSQTTWKLQSELTTEIKSDRKVPRQLRPRTSRNTMLPSNSKNESQQLRSIKLTGRNNQRKSKFNSIPRISRRKSKKEPVPVDEGESDYSELEPDTQPSTDVQNNAIAINNLSNLYSTLQRELSALQNKVCSMDKARVIKTYATRTKVKRMYIYHELSRQIRRSPNLSSGENQFKFSSALRRHPMEFTIECTLNDFCTIAVDIQNRYSSGVRYLPSLPTITSQAQPLSQKHIVFDTCDTFLGWVGLRTESDIDSYKTQVIRKKGKAIIQVFGGVHWDQDDEKRSLNFFYGRSSFRFLPIIKSEDVLTSTTSDTDVVACSTTMVSTGGVGCLSLSTAEWDEGNDKFENDFELSQAVTHIEHITANTLLDYDAFTLTWKPLQGLRSQDITNFHSEDERLVLGKLVVFIPAVLFFGDHLVEKLQSLITEIK